MTSEYKTKCFLPQNSGAKVIAVGVGTIISINKEALKIIAGGNYIYVPKNDEDERNVLSLVCQKRLSSRADDSNYDSSSNSGSDAWFLVGGWISAFVVHLLVLLFSMSVCSACVRVFMWVYIAVCVYSCVSLPLTVCVCLFLSVFMTLPLSFHCFSLCFCLYLHIYICLCQYISVPLFLSLALSVCSVCLYLSFCLSLFFYLCLCLSVSVSLCFSVCLRLGEQDPWSLVMLYFVASLLSYYSAQA